MEPRPHGQGLFGVQALSVRAGISGRVIAIALACLTPLAAQDTIAGKSIFEGKGRCLTCHSIDNRGGSLGPDLTEIGVMRTPDSLRESLLNPDAEIAKPYRTAVLTTKQGEHVEGIVLNEDDLSVQIRDTEGNPRSFLKDNLKDLHREERSLMPPYAQRLSASELNDLVGYLETLRGAADPHPAMTRERESSAFADSAAWLDRANRDSQEMPDTLMDNLPIKPGETIADIGAGTGYFTLRLAQRVGPKGKVIAVEIRQEMLDLIARRNLKNVSLVLDTETDPKLQPATVDLAFVANSYHEFTHPRDMMTAIRESLKPNGRLVVIEYAKEREDDDPTAGVATMSAPQLRSEIESFGFKLERVLDVLPSQHAMIFSR